VRLISVVTIPLFSPQCVPLYHKLIILSTIDRTSIDRVKVTVDAAAQELMDQNSTYFRVDRKFHQLRS
jgi:hypothetical protein